MIIGKILKESLGKNASDIILSSDCIPYLKIDGEVIPLDEYGVISKTDLENEIFSIMSERQKERFTKDLEFDFSIDLKGESRFRVNVFYQKRGLSIVFRHINSVLPEFQDLHIPPQVIDFVNRKS